MAMGARIRSGLRVTVRLEREVVVALAVDDLLRDLHLTTSHQTEGSIRKREMQAAARMMGIHDVVFLDQRDGSLEATLAVAAAINNSVGYDPEAAFRPLGRRRFASQRQTGVTHSGTRAHRQIPQCRQLFRRAQPTP